MEILLLNQLAAFLISLHYARRYYGILRKHSIKLFENYAKKHNISFNTQADDKDVYEMFNFITVAAIIITVGFVMIYVLPDILKSPFLTSVFQTGIQIPIIMIILGSILKRYKPGVANETKRKAMLLISIAINLSFISYNWSLSMIALAVIIGKFIWFDSALDIREAFKTLKMYITEKELDSELIKTYAFFYLVHYFFFYAVSISLPSKLAPNRVWIMLGVYCLMYIWNEFIVYRKRK